MKLKPFCCSLPSSAKGMMNIQDINFEITLYYKFKTKNSHCVWLKNTEGICFTEQRSTSNKFCSANQRLYSPFACIRFPLLSPFHVAPLTGFYVYEFPNSTEFRWMVPKLQKPLSVIKLTSSSFICMLSHVEADRGLPKTAKPTATIKIIMDDNRFHLWDIV